MRSLMGGNSNPKESCSPSNQAAPRPNSARPPEMTSRVVAVLAIKAGLRYVTPLTRVLSRTAFVSRARAASTDQPSSMGSSWRPMPGIWLRWSITVTRLNPAASAARAWATILSKMPSLGTSGKE